MLHRTADFVMSQSWLLTGPFKITNRVIHPFIHHMYIPNVTGWRVEYTLSQPQLIYVCYGLCTWMFLFHNQTILRHHITVDASKWSKESRCWHVVKWMQIWMSAFWSINKTSDTDGQVFCSRSTFDLNEHRFEVTTHLILTERPL